MNIDMVKMGDFYVNMISQFTSTNHADYIQDVKLKSNHKKYLLSVTNDMYLSEKQFVAIKKLLHQLGENNLYLIQYDGGTNFDDWKEGEDSVKQQYEQFGIFSPYNNVYVLNLDTNYSDYQDIPLYSLSVILSANGSFAIFIQEEKDFGTGLFVARREIIEQYKRIYEQLNITNYVFSDNQRAIDEYSISSECLKKLDYYTTKFLL